VAAAGCDRFLVFHILRGESAMRLRFSGAIAATFIVLSAGLAQAAGMRAANHNAALAPIHELVADMNKGDTKAAATLFTAQNDVTDEFPPFHWTGNGFDAWAADYTKMVAAQGLSGVMFHPSKPYVSLSRNRGYVVLPMHITWLQRGKKGGEVGDLVVVLAKEGIHWRITSWTWTHR
jgi:hypothetical protein